jgi:hypothetical protein
MQGVAAAPGLSDDIDLGAGVRNAEALQSAGCYPVLGQKFDSLKNFRLGPPRIGLDG